MTREDTKVIQIGTVKIGGGNPVAIQSMTNTKTECGSDCAANPCIRGGRMSDHPLCSADDGGGRGNPGD